MGKFYKTVMSEFYCTQCGKKGIPVYRKKGQERKAGHLKKLYCLYCNMETNHVEIKDNDNNYTYQNFREEFEAGRFTEGQRVDKKDLLHCSQQNCPFNKEGLCWNANYSYHCPHRLEKEDI